MLVSKIKNLALFIAFVISGNNFADDLNPNGARNVYDYNAPYDAIVKVFANNAYCSGSLIAPNVILTAAHCLPDDYYAFLQLGHLDGYATPKAIIQITSSDRLTRHYTASRFIHHPEYSPASWEYDGVPLDIGLIFLDEEVSNVEPLKIADHGSFEHDEIIFNGHGHMSGALNGPRRDNGFIQEVVLGNVEQKDVFFKVFEKNKGTCIGDSGGPAFIEEDGKRLIVGTLSFADPTTVMTQEQIDYLMKDGFANWEEFFYAYPDFDECAGGDSVFISAVEMKDWIEEMINR